MKVETKIALLGLRNMIAMVVGFIGYLGLALFAFVVSAMAFLTVVLPLFLPVPDTEWTFLVFSFCWVLMCIPMFIVIYRIARENAASVDFFDIDDFGRYSKLVMGVSADKPDVWLSKLSLPAWLKMSLEGFLTGLAVSCSIVCCFIPTMIYGMVLMMCTLSKWFVVSLWKKSQSLKNGSSSSFMSSLSEKLSSAVAPEERARMHAREEATSLGARASVSSAGKRKPRSSL